METYLVQPSSTAGRFKFIHFTVDGDTMTRRWGLIGGSDQETSHTYDVVNEGKSNEQSPEEAAETDYQRKIDKKVKEGYRVVDSLADAETISLDTMDFDTPPTSFSPSKPIKTAPAAKLEKLLKKKTVNVQIKYNGMCHFIIKGTTGEVRIYTRRMDDHTIKYPSIVKAAQELDLPNRTVLLCEFFASGFARHMEGFNFMQKISKAGVNKGKCKPDQSKSLERQAQHPVGAACYHMAYLHGEPTWKHTYDDVYQLMVERIPVDTYSPVFVPQAWSLSTLKEIDDNLAIHEGFIEGYVIWDGEAPIEITFNGKPLRRAAYKRKIKFEDDVVAYAWLEGKGDHQGSIGSLYIGKYDADGVIVPMGRVGSGLKDHQINPANWTFPCVVEVEYENRFIDGAFQFPVFIKVHEDKVPEEVTTKDDLIFGDDWPTE